MLLYAPHYADVRSGFTAPRNLNLHITLCVVGFTSRPVYPRGKGPRYPVDGKMGGLGAHPAGLDAVEKETSLPCRESNPDSLAVLSAAHSLHRLSYGNWTETHAIINSVLQISLNTSTRIRSRYNNVINPGRGFETDENISVHPGARGQCMN
jgi:hypothetical protein